MLSVVSPLADRVKVMFVCVVVCLMFILFGPETRKKDRESSFSLSLVLSCSSVCVFSDLEKQWFCKKKNKKKGKKNNRLSWSLLLLKQFSLLSTHSLITVSYCHLFPSRLEHDLITSTQLPIPASDRWRRRMNTSAVVVRIVVTVYSPGTGRPHTRDRVSPAVVPCSRSASCSCYPDSGPLHCFSSCHRRSFSCSRPWPGNCFYSFFWHYPPGYSSSSCGIRLTVMPPQRIGPPSSPDSVISDVQQLMVIWTFYPISWMASVPVLLLLLFLLSCLR